MCDEGCDVAAAGGEIIGWHIAAAPLSAHDSHCLTLHFVRLASAMNDCLKDKMKAALSAVLSTE